MRDPSKEFQNSNHSGIKINQNLNKNYKTVCVADGKNENKNFFSQKLETSCISIDEEDEI